MNLVVMMGRLTHDPEIKHTQSGTAVASFTLAVDRRVSKDKERETDFIDFTAWGKTAEFVSKYFVKGQRAVVRGRMQIDAWTDKEGNKRRSAQIMVDDINFADNKKTA